ncbi:spermidine/putrescine ABC transporter substrate-binding protein [Pseudomonas sp. TKO26]|uniref:ABC transporter substrate-binding protein n=1 Tax=unclassified Pseudomonas TaxID=196821 RepID=UPI000D86AB8C|nr:MULTISPECIES: extracellular solute-binding protein [unclassified Pseudomonas]PYY92029.1 spermidine/putrescine ABC transporter substrate-binding protein [Pseudomonas sp. TKO30]PYY94392.1 spermidine/putrescine ABC transporter substrate-binding protein [Pseudomonas sp. TKO29]PYY96265.1 spermidine/putrescine ABC transporter substrate-binding protein [Pseudomonas sp. TKO26]PYZ01857.1 spermidine/putrescine ABC transporter substrate-binding protein [Pseudomonas sp. TKO14]
MSKLIASLGTTLLLSLPLAVQAAEKLNVVSWSGYFSPEILAKFQKQTGIEVTVDSYDSNETLLAKLKQGGSGYDVAIPSHQFIPILIKEQLLERFDPVQEPYYSGIVDNLKQPTWDPQGAYSVPFIWGTTSVVLDTARYQGPTDSYRVLYEPPKELQGRINMFDSAGEVIDMASLYLNIPLCSEDPKQMQQILTLLKAQKPFVKTYSSKAGAIRENLAAGEIDMSTFWGGSSMRAREMKPSLKYLYPKEGVLAWVDNMVIPKGSKNPANAKAFIAFLSQPENAAMTQNFLKHQSPIKGVEPFLDAGLKDAPELHIPEGTKVVFSQTCGEGAIRLADRLWTNLMR